MWEHKFDVTFIEYRATLAHVVNVREHKFDVTLIDYVVTLAHTKKLEQIEANRFCPKRQIPWRNQRTSLEVGAKLPVEAKYFHQKFHFGRTSQMLVAEGISWINRHFQTVFPGVVKK